MLVCFGEEAGMGPGKTGLSGGDGGPNKVGSGASVEGRSWRWHLSRSLALI